jgi:uncharacterized protein YndB with AHSA1/START domain
MTIADQTVLLLEISRRFAASPERVFDAWVGREWCEWLGPPDSRCTILELDPRVGGTFRVAITMSDGREIEVSGTYTELRRAQKLAFGWNSDFANQKMTIAVTFRPDSGGTLMTLRQEGFPDADLQNGYKAGWTGAGGSFDKLADFLARAA